MDTENLVRRLANHPKLASQIEKMLDMAESRNEIKLADDAEDFVVDEGQKLSKIFLEEWADKQAIKTGKACEARHKSLRKDVKKNCNGTPL